LAGSSAATPASSFGIPVTTCRRHSAFIQACAMAEL
jgi:hypothetical protein